jgi:hypothetical protein
LALPDRIPVKISSEAAGTISITPVVRQELTAAQLVENILRVTGKDAARVREVLRQGTVVNGASRFRWESIQALPEEVDRVLTAFPDPDPHRPFHPDGCVRIRLLGGRSTVEVDRAAASRRRLFRRRSFWEAVLQVAGRLPLTYHDYSYGERADVYSADLPADALQELCDEAPLLRYSSLAATIRDHSWNRIELWVER